MTSPIRPPHHCVPYGDFGAGKSRFAASYPQPGLTWFFDGVGKETPYLKLGTPSERYLDEQGTPCVDVTNKKGELIWRVEYYLDTDPTKPEGVDRFNKRMAWFYDEVGDWATAVLDSSTSLELSSRMYEKYKKNKSAKDGRQWYGGAADTLEETICIRLASLPINVVVILHQDEAKDDVHGMFVRTVKAPPRLKKGIPSMYPELYHAYATQGDNGEILHLLQTKPDHLYAAASQIEAPDPCWNSYDSLWENWK